MGKRKRTHAEDVHGCRRCALALYRRNVVPYRLVGEAPARVLLIGEAPGRSEDLKGLAFVGPSGRLLDTILREVNVESALIVNCVMCRPCDEHGGSNREPTADEVLACRVNVDTAIRTYAPRPDGVVFLGKVAERYWRKEYPQGLALAHPAYLLRGGGVAHPAYMGQIRDFESYLAHVARVSSDAL